MYLKSHAKINLAINIKGKKEDGYHDLDMIMLPLKLFDFIEIDRLNYKDTYIVCDEIDSLSGKYNLVNDTISLLRKKYGFDTNYLVKIHKEIPIKAGLGGGSSNAAAVLKAVVKDNKIDATTDELIELSKSIGADVPYFLYNQPARVEGIGEKVTPIKIKHKYYVLLVKPDEGLATKSVFDECDAHEKKFTDIDALIDALANGDEDKIAALMYNALEDAAMCLLPEIKKIKDSLKEDGLNMVMMSGSGSCVYALSKSWLKLARLKPKYEKLGYEVVLTKIL